MLLIASFPRSGNHLIRFLIEYLTGRPTLGCPDQPADRPLFQNEFPGRPDILSHVRGEPVGQKVHFRNNVKAIEASAAIGGRVLIRRDPIEAIASHCGGIRFSSIALYKSIRRYAALERDYQRWPEPKVALSYERLITTDRNAFLGEVDKLLPLLGDVDGDRLTHLRDNFRHLRNVCAKMKAPTWRGVRSNRQARFYSSDVSKVRRVLVNVSVTALSLSI